MSDTTYSALPDAFGFASADGQPSYTIYQNDKSKGKREPMGNLRRMGDFPLPLNKLGENLADFLAGRNPSYFLGDGKQEMHHIPFPGGMMFNIRNKSEPGVAGVSETCATFTALPGFENVLSKCMAERPRDFDLFMSTGWRIDRRAEPRTAPDSKKRTPKNTPKPNSRL